MENTVVNPDKSSTFLRDIKLRGKDSEEVTRVEEPRDIRKVPDKKLKIVFIEDDKYLSSSLTLWLEANNFEIIVAYDGKEGIQKIKTEKPNLILLDLMLPVMDGFQVLEEMKKDPEIKSIPVLVLSNLSQDSDIQKVKEMGVSDYLVKSDVSMKDIVDCVKKILKSI